MAAPDTITVGFDASASLAPRTGVGRAVLGLLKGIAALEDPRLRLKVFINSLRRGPGPEHAFLSNLPHVEVIRRRRPGPWLVKGWAAGKGPAAEDLAPGVDVWHAPATYLPPARQARRIVTLYDVAFLEDPAAGRDVLGGGLFAEMLPRVLPETDLVITPSDFTRDRVLQAYNLPENRVALVRPGYDPEHFYPETERFVEIARQHVGIADKTYLLAVSDHTPRKRAQLLLDTYERLLKLDPRTPKLVVLGWRSTPPPELKMRPHLHRSVLLAEHLPDDLLAGLYSGALATIYTSRHEGFGFPVLEAMACGCPVVCARRTALPEVGGDAAQYVDSDAPEDWAEAVAKVAFSQDAHDRLHEAGIKRAEEFSWHECARETVALYRKVAGSG